jgi:predicted aldo/keto reductase-like oxidoreductase
VLVHLVTTSTWDTDLKSMLDALSEAKERKLIRLKGMSAHGLEALNRATEVDWADVNLVRINPQGVHCDGETADSEGPGDIPRVLECIQTMQERGRGVIGMKIIGHGEFTKPEEREESIHFAMNNQDVDAIVIGFRNLTEIDEALERMDRALSS